ncbi:MAG TPA: patatin-like phospholipase family protein [Gemmatimonadales bacterium]|nr:patatin-like phospholipase family protein [Gemmatimonadales bacterium]
MAASPQFNLVLGGGGLKGLTHIGVFKALEERGLAPQAVIGCSMGALVAAAWACRMSVPDMEQRALKVVRTDVFRIAHIDMALKRMLAPAIYRKEPLDHLIRSLVGDVTFRDLTRRLVVNTVDLNTGQQVLWGLPGLQDARVADAVFASCALPGILPPRNILDRYCIDGAVLENLPVRASLAISKVPIIAVDVGGTRVERKGVERKGFVATYSRGLEIVMQTLAAEHISEWSEPPVILVRPHVERVSMFAFNRTPFLLEEGYRAMNEALDSLPRGIDDLPPGIHPQREVWVRVERPRCIGCGACVARAPGLFEMGADGIAVAKSERQWWSPLGDYLLTACPTHAITAEQTWPQR